MPAADETPRGYRFIRVVVVILAVLGVLIAAGRIAMSFGSTEPPPRADVGAFLAFYDQHRALISSHVGPGLLFVILGPLQLSPRVRNAHPRFHRWSGRTYIVASLVIAISALVLVASQPSAGPAETSATIIYTAIFVFSLACAYRCIRRRDVRRHREWMIRAFSLGLGIATMRPIIMGLLTMTDLAFSEVLGVAFWTGWTIHLVAAEVWIRMTRTTHRSR